MSEEMKKECEKKDAEILADMFCDYRQINLLIAYKQSDYSNGDFAEGYEYIVDQFIDMKLLEIGDNDKQILSLRGEKVFDRLKEKGLIIETDKGYKTMRPVNPQPKKEDFKGIDR